MAFVLNGLADPLLLLDVSVCQYFAAPRCAHVLSLIDVSPFVVLRCAVLIYLFLACRCVVFCSLIRSPMLLVTYKLVGSGRNLVLVLFYNMFYVFMLVKPLEIFMVCVCYQCHFCMLVSDSSHEC